MIKDSLFPNTTYYRLPSPTEPSKAFKKRWTDTDSEI